MDRILIIEDDTEINNMMLEAVTRAGCRCAQAFFCTWITIPRRFREERFL